MTGILNINNLHTGYESIKVLDGVTMEVEKGEIVGLIGPNGAGKSTCFKAVFGLLEPWQGEIQFNGTQIGGSNPQAIIKEGLCYTMQGHRIFPRMTIEENLEIGGYLVDSSILDDRIDRVYETFPPLREKAEEDAGTLSGGQMKMLEIGMALVTDPEMMLLDEPSLGLAPEIRSQIFDIIHRLNEEEEISFLIIEQNIREVLEAANRAYVLEQGRVRMEGTGEELLSDDRIIELYIGAD